MRAHDPAPPPDNFPDEPPRDFKRLRAFIIERRSRLPKRLVQVADFAIARPQEIAFGRVADVAALAGVQPSTMIRFAQALGYSGFSEIQAVFLGYARERWPDYRERLEALGDETHGRAAADLLHGFMRASTESVDRLGDTIDPNALRRAVELLAQARTITLLGTRRAFPVVAYLSYALLRLGVRCELVEQSAGLGPEQAALIEAGDVLLAVSFSPYAPLTLELATAVHARGVAVVAITDGPFSPLAQVANVWLEVVEADHAAFRSLAGTFTLAATLAVAVAARHGAGDLGNSE